MLTRRRSERGDTLIEVLFSVAVFSFIVVGALGIMNQGTAASQRSLHVTIVRQTVDAQAESLRFLHDSYLAVYQPGITFNTVDATTTPAEEWYKISTNLTATSVSQLNATGTQCPTAPTGSFFINTQTVRFTNSAARMQRATNYAQLETVGGVTTARGIWIEAIRAQQSSDSDQANTGYIDFHVRACWIGPGLGVPMTLGTIVRLYEPRT